MGADLVESIPDDSSLSTLDFSGNVVGLEGLRAINEALIRCPSLREIFLYDIGPWIDGDGLGCRPNAEEELTLLPEMCNTVKGKGGVLQNEAFLTDACADKMAVPGKPAHVKNNSIKGGRVMLRSRPVDGGGRFCKGWINDGQQVFALTAITSGQWVYVRKPAPDHVKGWLKSCNVQAS